MPYGLQHTELYRDCADGERIVTEGEDGREMFIIDSGAVRIVKQAGDDQVVLATLERGDFFGEMSLLESSARDASAVAVGPTRLLVIQPGGLLLRMRRDPTFAFEMLHKLSGRVRQLNARIIQLLEERPQAEDGRQEVPLVPDP